MATQTKNTPKQQAIIRQNERESEENVTNNQTILVKKLGALYHTLMSTVSNDEFYRFLKALFFRHK